MRPGNCCRRAAVANPRDFCASVSMSTPVLVEISGSGAKLTVLTPGGQRTPLADALVHFGCQANSTPGLRLAGIVTAAMGKVIAANMTHVLPANRQYPLLMVKDLLFKVVERCATCGGSGCGACGNLGFSGRVGS